MLRKIIPGKLSRVFYLSGIIVLLLSACASQQIPTGITSPTSVPIEISPSVTVTSIPTITPRPTQTVTATSTVDAITALASEFNIPAECLSAYRISSDRNWIGADCPSASELIIANKSLKSKIILPYQELVKEVDPNLSTLPLSWSSDNRYFYFTTLCCNDTSSNSNGSLYRFDTEKESLSIIVRGKYEPFYYFSNDGNRYVFLNHYQDSINSLFPENLEIGMADILANKNKRAVFQYLLGPIYGTDHIYGKATTEWSKDNNKFAIVLLRPRLEGDQALYDQLLLTFDFVHMSMKLVEKFDENNLLGE